MNGKSRNEQRSYEKLFKGLILIFVLLATDSAALMANTADQRSVELECILFNGDTLEESRRILKTERFQLQLGSQEDVSYGFQHVDPLYDYALSAEITIRYWQPDVLNFWIFAEENSHQKHMLVGNSSVWPLAERSNHKKYGRVAIRAQSAYPVSHPLYALDCRQLNTVQMQTSLIR